MKRENVRIAIAQINCTVGDLEGNANKIIAFSHRAAGIGADIISFPELAICGYPPEDLLLKPQFISDNLEQLKRIARNTGDMVAVVGFVDRTKDGLYNAAAVIHGGRIAGVYHKMFLPNYGVFDEARYFRQGTAPRVFKYGGCIFGVTICEDIWYKNGPALSEAASGAGLIININASPYCRGKLSLRRRIVSSQAKATRAVISYNNLVGGQDELVFDGRSMIVLPGGKVAAMGGAFCEDFLVADVPVTVVAGKAARGVVNISMRNEPRRKAPLIHNKAAVMGEAEEVYNALMLGLRDYVNKNGFKKVVIGLSGGIDSALVAAIAVDALGCENVTGIAMPSRYTSAASKDDAARLAKNLGIALKEIPIDSLFSAYLAVLKPHFDELPQDITEENLQARIRGNIMMALSNKFGWLVLTTGNKSEMSVGYATLYGDMAGGFALIKDVPKMLVYALSKYRNAKEEIIPARIIKKAPTAELRPGQKDTDSLPPYRVLDEILRAYVEGDECARDISARGFAIKTVKKVQAMVDRSEYKRRQSPPGIKITERAFGKDRRMPITNRYRSANEN